MTNLEAPVPPHEPAEGVLALVAKIGLGAIPVVGPMFAETLAYGLDNRQAERQHEFNVYIAEELARVAAEQSDTRPIDIDGMIAAVSHGQRIAAETASEAKRRRLAAATVANFMSDYSLSERAQFMRLVEELDDFHVWLLNYFAGPQAWLDAHGMSGVYSGGFGGAATQPLSHILGRENESQWAAPLRNALEDLQRLDLANIPAGHMSAQGMITTRTTERGLRFLEYLNQGPSAAAEVPDAL